MIKDSKLHVDFNKHDCGIQDLKKENVLGTGSEYGGLYMFDVDCDLIHLDLWGPYRVTSREGYRYFLTIVDDFSRHQNISSPNDDKEGPYDDAREVTVDHQSTDSAEEQPFDDDVHTASSMDDNPISEGNVPCIQNVPTYDSSNRTDDDNPVCVNTRRSSRMSKLPDKLNDFVLDNKVKYGLNRI
nr:ribonuclease H-like domain-containing protein [Tanacetum cinerariifolium]